MRADYQNYQYLLQIIKEIVVSPGEPLVQKKTSINDKLKRDWPNKRSFIKQVLVPSGHLMGSYSTSTAVLSWCFPQACRSVHGCLVQWPLQRCSGPRPDAQGQPYLCAPWRQFFFCNSSFIHATESNLRKICYQLFVTDSKLILGFYCSVNSTRSPQDKSHIPDYFTPVQNTSH